MSRMKTFLLVLLILPLPVRAAEETLISTFASCAGRFSAELEHAWLINDERASDFEQRRLQFIELLAAVVPRDQERVALHLRIDAKVAHTRLLSDASFANDTERSRWAVRRAKSEIDYCKGFLLES